MRSLVLSCLVFWKQSNTVEQVRAVPSASAACWAGSSRSPVLAKCKPWVEVLIKGARADQWNVARGTASCLHPCTAALLHPVQISHSANTPIMICYDL